MSVSAIIIAAVVVGGTGIVIGIILGIAGEKFKLAGAGPRPEDRGIGVSPDGVVQRADEVGDALGEGELAEFLKIRPGFIHNGHNIGPLRAHLRGVGGGDLRRIIALPGRDGETGGLHMGKLRRAMDIAEGVRSCAQHCGGTEQQQRTAGKHRTGMEDPEGLLNDHFRSNPANGDQHQ